jgi:hypothetical protein
MLLYAREHSAGELLQATVAVEVLEDSGVAIVVPRVAACGLESTAGVSVKRAMKACRSDGAMIVDHRRGAAGAPSVRREQANATARTDRACGSRVLSGGN